MRIALYTTPFFFIAFVLLVGVLFIQKEVLDTTNQEAQILKTPALTAKAWAVFDVETGEIRNGQGVDEVLPIASITKLFTATLVRESGREAEKVRILLEDIEAEGRAGKLTYGSEMTLYELLFPLLLESSNDAGHAIQRSFGSTFDEEVANMIVDLPATKIVEATGLSPLNVSSPRDLAHVYAFLKKTHPHLLNITELSMYVAKDTGYINNNPGRTFSSFEGGKHGYTDEAGRTFVGAFSRGVDTSEIGIVLLGSEDLISDIKLILEQYRSF